MTAFFRRFSELLFNKPHPRQDSAKDTGGSLVKLYDKKLKHPDALINRANKRVINGDLEGALSDFTEAISLNPSKATAYFNRGLLYNTLGKFEAAIDDLSESIALLPDYDEAFFHRGNSYRQLQDVQRAIQDYSQAIRLNPYCIKAYYKRAESRSELGFSPSALMDYSRVIVRLPKDPNAYFQRGLYLRKSGELAQAIEDFSVAIRLNPRLADAYFHRGYCQAELGKTDKAAQDYSEAIRLNPNHQAAKDQALAVAALKEVPGDASALPQKSPPIQQNVAQETEAGSTDNSSKLVALQSQLSPVLAKLFDRANHRSQQGDLEGAIADYTQILAQDPQNSQAYFGRGRSLKATGDMKSAMVDIMQSIHWARVNSLGTMRDFNSELSNAVVALKQDLENLSYQRPVFSTKALKPASPRPLADSTPDQRSAAFNQSSTTSAVGNSAYPVQKTSALSRTISTPPSTPAASPTFSKAEQKLVAADTTNPLDTAIAQLTHAIQANPLDADAFFRRGQSRALAGDLKGAIEDYSRSLRLDPHNREAYIHRAHCRSVLGDTAAAQEDLNHLIRHQPIPRVQPSALPQPANGRPQLPAAVSNPSELPASSSDGKSSPPELATSSAPEAPSPQAVEQSAAQLSPLESVDITQEMASLFQQENAILHASQISDRTVCTHSGNNSENKFCIHCGEPLIRQDQSDESAWEGTLQEPVKPMDSQRVQRLQEAEQHYSQGLSLFRAGDRQGSLQALSAGLKIFLEQRAMQNYQKTLSLMQDVAHTLAKSGREVEESDNGLRL